MNKIVLLPFFLLYAFISMAQLCPGGGTDYANAVFFNTAWTSGCSAGSSCNGGTQFSNLAACEPTTAINSCVPAPTCGNLSNMGSDIWFKFYAISPNAVISINQNTSFVASIQAFSEAVENNCASLSQIGCVVAGGPSGGVKLTLNSLTPGNLYYFRIYGTAAAPSQRTGLFCFCGSSGMVNVVLPVKILSFTDQSFGSLTTLKWTTSGQANLASFDIEKSEDGLNFRRIGTKPVIQSVSTQNDYFFDDITSASQSNTFYRLKMIDIDGHYEYSFILKANNIPPSQKFSAIVDNAKQQLNIQTDKDGEVYVSNMVGQKIATIQVKRGLNNFHYDWQKGVYIIRRNDVSEPLRVYVK